MKIAEFARASGLSTDTARYYERIGLLPRPPRDGSGHRDYDPKDLIWTAFLDRLKTTGMPIREMLRYARLRALGPRTETERHELLVAHRAGLLLHIAALSDCVGVLDAKIATYAKIETSPAKGNLDD